MDKLKTRTKARWGSSEAADRNPHGPTQGKLSARPMVLTDQVRTRGSRRSRRRTARTWRVA